MFFENWKIFLFKLDSYIKFVKSLVRKFRIVDSLFSKAHPPPSFTMTLKKKMD